MAGSLRTLALITACGAFAACAHAAPAPIAAAAPDLPPLGEDLPEPAPAASGSARLAAIDMPVGALCKNAAARRVVDRDLPGLTGRPEYVFFKRMTLRQLQAASRGQMTLADLERVAFDLSALDAPGGAPLVQASASLP